MFVVSYSRIKNMGPQLLSAHIKGQKWVVEPVLKDFGVFGQDCKIWLHFWPLIWALKS